MLISTTGDRSLATIHVPDMNKEYKIVYDPDSRSHYLLEIDPLTADKFEDSPAVIPPPPTPEEQKQIENIQKRLLNNQESTAYTVDVMVVYTPAAKQWADSSGGGITNVVNQAMEKARLVAENTLTELDVQLVHATEISYTESDNSETDLKRLQITGDGYLDSVHTLRNTFGADIIVLFTKMEDTGGIGYLLDSASGRPEYAFSISRVQQAGSTFTTIHEIGHNMGLGHHKEQNVQPGPGLFSYSAGWRWTSTDSNRYCSVMTYENGKYFSDGQTHTRVAYFSNPSLTYIGATVGDAEDGDNARNVREIKKIIAAYRNASVKESKVPDTGQTKCYDVAGKEITCPSPGQALYGQDANYTINPMSYTKLDSSGKTLPDLATTWSMVRDNVTGLIWEMKTNKDGVKNYNNPHDADNIYEWYDSNPATNGGYAGTPGDGTDTEDFIKALNDAHYGGYSDWRLPTVKELAYIIDYSISPYPGPTTNTAYFPNTVSSDYWSSTTTTTAYSTDAAWGVCFHFGGDYISSKNYSAYVRAVRGGQSGAFGDLVIGSFNISGDDDLGEMVSAGTYTDNGDDTVTDVSTGLMWQQKSPTETMTWEAALAYCEGLNLGGYTEWRLPNERELRSIVDYSRSNPAINTSFFPNAVASFCWSSTTHRSYTYNAWVVAFDNGFVNFYDKPDGGYVRAVRGGQSGSLGNLVISPLSQAVTKDAGSTTFSVSNNGTGTMPWTVAIISGGDWLSITSGASGTNAGTITCAYTANTSTASRTGTIRVTANGVTGSPKDVTVTQAGASTTAQVISLWPVNNAHAGSTSTLWADVKNTGSSALPSNALVWYYVSGPNWTNYWVGYAYVSGLPPGSTKWYSYNWAIPPTATPGTYTYWARVYQGSTALSNWSAAQSFTVSVNQKAVITSPVNGSQLASTTQTFTRTSVSGATQYWLYLGSAIGGTNLYNQSTGTSTSRTVTGLPSNGSMIYARLWTQYGGAWLYNDYSYRSH